MAYSSMNEGIGLRYLDKKDQEVFALGTLIKISVISGCPSPTDPEHKKIIRNEMLRFLLGKNEYSTMTASEIACAFRFNSTGNYEQRIEHYQNVFNLDYFGKVMELWLKIKREIQAKADLEEMRLNIYEPEELFGNMETEEVLKYSKQKWNESENYLFILSSTYDSLKLNGSLILHDEEKETIRNKARDVFNHLIRYYRSWLPRNDFLLSEEGENYGKNKLSKKIAVAEHFVKEKGSNTNSSLQAWNK